MKRELTLVPFNVNPRIIAVTQVQEDKGSIELRNSLIAKAKALKPITDAETDTAAVECGREIRRVIKSANERFAELKRPILDAGTMLKSLLDAFVGPLEAEQQRLERQHTLFEQEERKRIAAEEQKQREAIAEAQRIADEAARKAQEASERVRGARTLDTALKAQEEANRAQDSVITQMTKPVPVLEKPRGAAARLRLKYRVTDIAKVFAANPLLCKPLEIAPSVVNCLRPKEGSTSENPDQSILGLEIWMEAETSFRC
jgi:hypothetical protein